MNVADLPTETLTLLRKGTALPAHPLLLDENRQLDVERQSAVTRYYMDAGAGGVAVGVHTTQFAICREAASHANAPKRLKRPRAVSSGATRRTVSFECPARVLARPSPAVRQ